jgi:PhnB protein
MQIDPYLNFNGQCEAAFKFYEQSLGGKIQMLMTFKDSPMASSIPAEWAGKVMHARMTIGEQVLMGSDPPPPHFQQPQGFSISITTKDVSEGERIFKALADNGKVHMPFQKTFWSPGFGMLVDRFGTPWMVNCEEAA